MRSVPASSGPRPRWLVLLLLLAAVGLPAAVLSGGPEATKGKPREAVTETVHAMLRAWETGDVAGFATMVGEPILFAYPGGRLDRRELLETFRQYAAAKRDVRIYFGRCLVEGDRFAIEYQFAATDRASGARQAVGSAAAGRVEHGRIVLFKEFYDEHVAPRQARGEIPLDEGKVFPYPASVMMTPEHIN